MSAEKLKKALQHMPEIGPLGFEGLVTKLLEMILNESFVLARSGDQPSGDAHNLRRGICVQAKRYSNRSPNAKTIEGDFDQSLRTLPHTDIYVIAVTRNTAQLDDTFEAMREKSGVDVVVLDFSSADSALPALCIEYWTQLLNFQSLQFLEVDIGNWIKTRSAEKKHKERIIRLKQEIRNCTQTHAAIRAAAKLHLRRRFQLESDSLSPTHHPIDLQSAVDRPAYRSSAVAWWRDNKTRAFVLKAPEGYGKSWVAAQCAQSISELDESVVFWLDSLHWRECTSIDAVLNLAISHLDIGDEQKVGRLVRKLKERWSGLVLIVLDGVNERNALPAAQKIIDDLIAIQRGNFRLIFTTRPLEKVSAFEPSLWNRWTELSISYFDDTELLAALGKAGISPTELTKDIVPLARIPRYFATCLRLRKTLQKFSNISIEIVLWADLLDKINGFEPGFRESLRLTSEHDAIEVLTKLATSLPAATEKDRALELLNDCFGGRYIEVRNYLLELRILEKAGRFEAQLTKEHSILGRALFLKQAFKSITATRVSDVADQFLEILEPLAEEDGSVESIFVALQLTAIEADISRERLMLYRAALLLAWMLSRNSNNSEDRLSFWCGHDVVAYVQFVEAFFEQYYLADSQQFVVTPLARFWKAGGVVAATFSIYLRRWLRLVWFEGCSGKEFELKGHRLPIATTSDQLRLSAVAISILSLRIEDSFLPDLAICVATDEISWHRINNHQCPIKFVSDNVGILMRWHYTEDVLPRLEHLATEHKSDDLLLAGLRRLAHDLQLYFLPNILQLPPRSSQIFHLGTPPADLIQQGRRVFDCTRTGPFPNVREFGYLAIRTDLPNILSEDSDFVRRAVESLVANNCSLDYVERFIADHDLDAYWPWYAKNFPLELARVAGQLTLKALRGSQLQGIFHFLAGVLLSLDSTEVAEWETLAKSKVSALKVINGRLENYTVVSIAEAAILLLSEDAIHRWIIESATEEGRRYSLAFDPIGDLIRRIAPKGIGPLAIEKCIAFGDAPVQASWYLSTELDYWCYIASLTSGPNEKLYTWSRNQLLQTPDGKEPNFQLVGAWLRSAPVGKLEIDLAGPNAKKLFGKSALRAWGVGGKLEFDDRLVTGSYEDLMQKLPQGFAGGLFARTGRHEDLNRWGKELFSYALNQLGKPPIERSSQLSTYINLDDNRFVQKVGFENPAQFSFQTTNASFWGVDSTFPGGSGVISRQKLLDQEIDRWLTDEEKLEKWEGYEMHLFGGCLALEAWSEVNLQEFLPRAQAILRLAADHPSAQFHIGGFLHAVICCLLPYAPKDAWNYYIAMNGGQLRINVESNYSVPRFFDALWDLNRCKKPAHDNLRHELFAESRNEFEVMVQCAAALANSACSNLLQIADQFLRCAIARDRALGVSILAWVGTKDSVARLCHIKKADPSRWIRGHANWAFEVSAQEMGARSFFRELLHKTDPLVVSAGLQVIKPALTPLARWWYSNILDEEIRDGLILAPKAAAILESFWHHWSCVRTSYVSVHGQRLDEVCRGQPLDQLKTPKLAPWWEIE